MDISVLMCVRHLVVEIKNRNKGSDVRYPSKSFEHVQVTVTGYGLLLAIKYE